MCKADEAYKEALNRFEKFHESAFRNVPDYDLYKLPLYDDYKMYPKDKIKGIIEQKSLKKGDDYRVIALKYQKNSSLPLHTHRHYFEKIMVFSGYFKDQKGKIYNNNDIIDIDGYIPHALESLSDGILLIMYSKDEKYIKTENFSKYISLIS